MSSTPSNSTEPGAPPPSSRPSGSAIALVVVTLGLLGALVWALHPNNPHFVPAPLAAVSGECPKVQPEFIASNHTDLPGPLLEGLSLRQRNRALYRLNTEPCPCGCNWSVAACRVNHPACEACKKLAEQIVAEVLAERPKQKYQPAPESAPALK